ncbi:MAG: hypothetical protein MUE85_01875 [Microscillaceae bacterium]|jgi:hypothetical protein|nr:hypothetical protein [Microscillaceae bacterium]
MRFFIKFNLYFFLFNLLIINALANNNQPRTRCTIHDFHTSIAEVNYNEKSQSLEVSLRVFTDDFEIALGKPNGIAELRLDNSKKYNDLIKKYLEANFYFADGKNQKLLLSFIGKELEGDVTWLYFEFPLKKSLKGYQLKNAVLTELFDDQSNLVNIFYKKQKRTHLFKRGEVSQKLDFTI